jgi:hypothetical protein
MNKKIAIQFIIHFLIALILSSLLSDDTITKIKLAGHSLVATGLFLLIVNNAGDKEETEQSAITSMAAAGVLMLGGAIGVIMQLIQLSE